MTPTATILQAVHERIGLGVDISTFADGTIEVRWRRDYDGEHSDERFLLGGGHDIDDVLRRILDYETEADQADDDYDQADTEGGIQW